MSIGFWQIALIALLVLLLFGRGKISDLMGDVAKGIKSFKSGLKDDETSPPAEAAPPQQVEHTPAPRTEAPAESADRKTS
ncbi:Sec-independent protein translocase protein TatA [Agaricicola taiwanensis]|uniref:Sec-independent protein translocase protein TatA n=1 Tax=Agaricicola taiwanensis TaxID=591372 RepID=A0A8J3DXB7_9RHOB|nr:twin-arginine translocase TatA/TatE family subunit [Agaricicola taiwanensis]GGE45367.1 Sec-independent protein translocase protein TatA [Agaricicola taiwanensis]